MIALRNETVNRLTELLADYKAKGLGELTAPSDEAVALFNFVKNLSQNEQIALAAVTWLGRGDFATFTEATLHGEQLAGDRDGLQVEYIVGKLTNERYLTDGYRSPERGRNRTRLKTRFL